MAVQFPKAGCFKKLDIEKIVAKNGRRAKESLPNRFIRFPDWRDEFGRWTRDCRSPQCYEAYMRGEFDEDAERWFHAGRSPIHAYFHAAIAWDNARGGQAEENKP